MRQAEIGCGSRVEGFRFLKPSNLNLSTWNLLTRSFKANAAHHGVDIPNEKRIEIRCSIFTASGSTAPSRSEGDGVNPTSASRFERRRDRRITAFIDKNYNDEAPRTDARAR